MLQVDYFFISIARFSVMSLGRLLFNDIFLDSFALRVAASFYLSWA